MRKLLKEYKHKVYLYKTTTGYEVSFPADKVSLIPTEKEAEGIYNMLVKFYRTRPKVIFSKSYMRGVDGVYKVLRELYTLRKVLGLSFPEDATPLGMKSFSFSLPGVVAVKDKTLFRSGSYRIAHIRADFLGVKVSAYALFEWNKYSRVGVPEFDSLTHSERQRISRRLTDVRNMKRTARKFWNSYPEEAAALLYLAKSGKLSFDYLAGKVTKTLLLPSRRDAEEAIEELKAYGYVRGREKLTLTSSGGEVALAMMLYVKELSDKKVVKKSIKRILMCLKR